MNTGGIDPAASVHGANITGTNPAMIGLKIGHNSGTSTRMQRCASAAATEGPWQRDSARSCEDWTSASSL